MLAVMHRTMQPRPRLNGRLITLLNTMRVPGRSQANDLPSQAIRECVRWRVDNQSLRYEGFWSYTDR